MSLELIIVTLIDADTTRQALAKCLSEKSYHVHWSPTEADFHRWIEENFHQIDCLILDHSAQTLNALEELRTAGFLLPAILVEADGADPSFHIRAEIYHKAVTVVTLDNLDQLERYLHQAIKHFLDLPATQSEASPSLKASHSMLLRSQQQRLTDKLKERLGYLGVYYKRNSDQFLRNMSQSEQEELLDQLREEYRVIILKYFSNQSDINDKIDNFVNIAFFADISVSQLVEIHMDLMDEFSKQLKLEGRSEEILLDYRLTLIDVIAHLCEMYRRSIPREP